MKYVIGAAKGAAVGAAIGMAFTVVGVALVLWISVWPEFWQFPVAVVTTAIGTGALMGMMLADGDKP